MNVVQTRGRVVRLLTVFALAVTALVWPSHSASAQTAPTVSASPNCGPVGTAGTYTIGVSGASWPASTVVGISFNGVFQTRVVASSTGTFSTTITPASQPQGIYTISAAGGNFTATTRFGVPCPGIALNPTCGPVGTRLQTYSITVTGSNFGRSTTAVNSVRVLFSGTGQSFTTNADGFGNISVVITPGQVAAGSYSVTATDSLGLTAGAGFIVPCPPPPTTGTSSTTTTSTTTTSTPGTTGTTRPGTTAPPTTGPGTTAPPTTAVVTTAPPVTVPGTTTTSAPPPPPPTPSISCRVDPPIGPPGFVTTLSCSGFPAGAQVTVRWFPGLGSGSTVADAAGNISSPMLVFRHDALGPRAAVAQTATANGQAPFLVVPGTAQPGGRSSDVAQIVRLVNRF